MPDPPTAPEDWLGGGSIEPDGTPVADRGVPAGVLLSGLIILEEPEVSPLYGFGVSLEDNSRCSGDECLGDADFLLMVSPLREVRGDTRPICHRR